MTNNLPANIISAIESALVQGDLSKLTSDQRLAYYKQVCDSIGVNPLTKPFEYITLNGKLTLYAKRDATDQLRKVHKVSIKITAREKIDDVYVVTAQASDSSGRFDESTGAVNVTGLKGEALANAFLKAETKAKRRVTLSLCGLGLLDESEVADIPQEAKAKDVSPSQVVESKKQDLGEYVCRVGKKYVGQKLKDIDPFELNNFLNWLADSTRPKYQPMNADFQEFYANAEAYLQSLEGPTSANDLFDLEEN